MDISEEVLEQAMTRFDTAGIVAEKGSAVLMIEDGIYGAMKGTIKSSLVTDAMGDISFYVLGADLKARGISESQIIDGVNVVDYNGFVDLVAEHDTTQSWL